MSDRGPNDDLHFGRDPNDASWVVFRYPWDWDPPAGASAPQLVALRPDPARGVVELDPAALSDDGPPLEGWPLAAVTGPDGALYLSSPFKHRILRKRPCEADYLPWPGVGGYGTATGQLKTPLGLAVDDHGFLYVADSGNHRVQVFRLSDASAVLILGRRDDWGEPLSGSERGAIIEPVDVAVSQTNIFVADRGARQVLVFDRGFRYQRSFALPLPAGTGAVAPFAIAVEPDGTLLLADTRWPRLLHANADGSSLPEVALGGTDNPRFAGLRLAQRFSPEGEAIIGPLDGQDHDIAWHEIIVEADLPEGTALSLQTYASNTASPAATPPWAPDAPVPIPQAAEGDRMAGGQCGEFRRLVLPAPSAGQATDRGRYLWLRLRFFGRKQRESDEVASATPALRSLRALGPRLSYLSYLPAIYSRRDPAADAPGALFLERYLTLFERVLTGIEESYEEVSRLLNLDATTPEWLSWLASWLGLALDPSWPLDRRRQLLGNALALYRLRGTPEGLSRYVEIYSGSRPELMEGFRTRARPAGVLGQSWVLGCVPVGDGSACLPGARSGGAHRFRLYAYVDDGCAKEKVEAAVRAIVDANKPAHTDYDLCIVRPDARVGLQSTVGLDLVVGGSPPEPSILGEGRTRTGAEPRPVLGKNLFLGGDAPALHTAAGLPLDAVAPPVLDDDFTLT